MFEQNALNYWELKSKQSGIRSFLLIDAIVKWMFWRQLMIPSQQKYAASSLGQFTTFAWHVTDRSDS